MENNLENKAKYFAQYWGQKVLSNVNYDRVFTPFVDVFALRSDVIAKTDHLILKPLSSISDENAFEVAKIVTGRNLQSDVQSYINDAKKELETFGTIGIWRIDVYQYLQSKGYALRFGGLSVEQLIEYGWLKLATS